MVLPATRTGRIAAALLAVFFVATMPPAVGLASTERLVAGQAALYLWAVGWGAVAVAVLLWAARVDAFALTEDQVPPELRERGDVAVREGEGEGGEVEG